MRSVTVRLEHKAREKILAFAEAVTTEIGGLLAVRQEGQTLIVEDAWTIPQEVSAGAVDFEPGYFDDYIKAQGWANGRPMPHICMGTWHSHANAGCFWSSTDEEKLSRKFAMRGFLVNLVVNRRGEWLCQVDSMVGPEHGRPGDYTLVTVPSTLQHVIVRDPAILALVQAEIAANVRERKYVITAGPWVKGKGKDEDSYLEGFWGHWPYNHDPVDEDWRRDRRNRKHTKNMSRFEKAREREPSYLSLRSGVWTVDKKNRCLVKYYNGKVIASITDMGEGTMTLFDDDGKIIASDKNSTLRPKGYLPPADL